MPAFCAAYGCNNRRTTESRTRGITFHKFPKDKALRKKWEVAVRRKHFVATDSSMLCSEHFKPEHFDRTGQTIRLRDGTTPTVFNFPSRSRKSGASKVKREESTPLDLTVPIQEVVVPAAPCPESQPQSCDDHSYALHDSPTRLKARLRDAMARVETLEREKLNSKIRERRAKKTLKGLMEDLKKKNSINDELKERLYFYSDLPMELFSKQGHEYTNEQKQFALTLHLYGPKAYSYLRDYLQLPLPHPHTLQRWMQTENSKPWFNTMTLDMLEREEDPAKAVNFTVFMSSLAREAGEKICQLVRECLEALQGGSEMEELKQRLEAAETELELVLERSKVEEELDEWRSQAKETEGVQRSRRSGGLSDTGVFADESGVKRSPILHLWKGRTYEGGVQPVLITEEGLEAVADHTSSDLNHSVEGVGLNDDDDPDEQLEPEDLDEGDPGYSTRPKHVSKFLRGHRKKDQPLSCRLCRKSFNNLLQLKAHQSVHGANTEKPLHCSQCGRGFSIQRSLNAHMLLHTGERPHTCEICGKGFTLKQLLRNHQRLHADVRPFRCGQCGKSFYRAHSLKMHQRVHTRERVYECEYCAKRFTMPGNLQRHRRIHTGEKPFSCDICGKSFTQVDTLKGHQMIHTGERPFTCDTCGKGFIQKSSLKTHQKTSHSGGSTLACVACGAKAACVDALRTHLQTHAATMPCTCVLCGSTLSSITDLRSHQRHHEADRPHSCCHCGKKFRSSSYLKVHMKTHSGEKPYACDICCRMFTQQSSLKSHQVVHTGEKPFSCDTCGKRFNNTGNLNRHQRIHTGEKPFICSTCGRSFNQGNSLKAHQQIHTGHKPFMCDMCGKNFSYMRNLKDHKCVYV